MYCEHFIKNILYFKHINLIKGAAISINQPLSHISLNVISNGVCLATFPLVLQPSNICTSGLGGIGPCRGDSGGPLTVTRNDRHILVWIILVFLLVLFISVFEKLVLAVNTTTIVSGMVIELRTIDMKM